ncbi:hypothetical protein ACFPRL_29815 [Pseudoclavibacter helvolus]
MAQVVEVLVVLLKGAVANGGNAPELLIDALGGGASVPPRRESAEVSLGLARDGVEEALPHEGDRLPFWAEGDIDDVVDDGWHGSSFT